MKSGWMKYAAFLLLPALTPFSVSAQYEKIQEDTLRDARTQLAVLKEKTQSPLLQVLLGSVSEKEPRALLNAVRVARDIQARPGRFDGVVVHYSVPAMSDTMRLPDTYPNDGKAFGEVRIFAARGEYEPGSFVVYPLANFGKVKFELTPFVTGDGKTFPADKLDLKVVKVWYQNGNGWFSYFGDMGLKLTPELLLNDEDLIKVDTKNVQNYARLTDPETKKISYRWITAPFSIDRRYYLLGHRRYQPFQSMKQNFRDAASLQPVTLNRGEFKQFFLTAQAAKDQAAGTYRGAIRMVKDGKEIGRVPAVLKVLPFELPEPCAYYDTNKPFLVSSYNYSSLEFILGQNGGDRALAEKQLENVLKNLAAHNETMHMIRGEIQRHMYEYQLTLDLMKKAGMRTDYFMASGGGFRYEDKIYWEHYARLARKFFDEKLGRDATVFLMWGDEPHVSFFIDYRDLFATFEKYNFRQVIAAGDQAFFGGGYYLDFFNTATYPEHPEKTRQWNEVGHAWVAWYAGQHVGAENPAFNRRQYGIAPYLSNFSAHCNYAHHFGPYNDRSEGYKPMVFAYGSGDGVIDTLQWEGFREGLDDIRYATYLLRLADEAQTSKEIRVRHAGRIARQMFAETDKVSCDMNELRMEMIAKIMELRAMLKK